MVSDMKHYGGVWLGLMCVKWKWVPDFLTLVFGLNFKVTGMGTCILFPVNINTTYYLGFKNSSRPIQLNFLLRLPHFDRALSISTSRYFIPQSLSVHFFLSLRFFISPPLSLPFFDLFLLYLLCFNLPISDTHTTNCKIFKFTIFKNQLKFIF